MYEKRFLRPVDKMGKMVLAIEYMSGNAFEAISAKVSATNFLLTCLVDYIIGERKQQRLSMQ
jgi:hypothetical protein